MSMRFQRRPVLDGLNGRATSGVAHKGVVPNGVGPEGVAHGAVAPSATPSAGSRAPVTRRYGSVQETHMRMETIERDTIRLAGNEYRAVVECVGVAVHLLPVHEQEGVLAGQASFLNALPFPTQLLVRIQRRSLEPHIRAIQRGAEGFAGRPETAALTSMAEGYVEYLRGLHEQAVLLDRRCYVIVPADPLVVQAALPTPPSGWRRMLALLSRRRARVEDDDAVEEAPAGPRLADPREAIYAHLQFRCDQVIRLLDRSGMQAWRVTAPALHHLLYSCWNPELARLYPLDRDHLAFHMDGAPTTSIVAHQVRR
ncbi:MAG TPA: hypothetical protein VHS99_18435 [Chloroflexota bacterium]|nr:hypothetical protein [Chloroflexota bacterium]